MTGRVLASDLTRDWYHAHGPWRRETNGGPVTAEILTTHVGSLPRSAEVTGLLFAAERGE